MSSKLHNPITIHSVVAPSGELRGKGRCGMFAGKTVCSTPERLKGELLTTRRYTSLRLPLALHLLFHIIA